MDFNTLVDTVVKPRLPRINGFLTLPPKRNGPVSYKSRANSGRALVIGGYVGKKGAWVVLHDKDRDTRVIVRPSQVSK